MSVPQNDKELQKRILRLSQEEIDSPMDVIKSVFLEITLEELRKMFRDILETCLTTDDLAFSDANSRYTLLSNLKRLERLLEAASLL